MSQENAASFLRSVSEVLFCRLYILILMISLKAEEEEERDVSICKACFAVKNCYHSTEHSWYFGTQYLALAEIYNAYSISDIYISSNKLEDGH